MTEPIQITAPILPGATVQQAKDHLRITHDDEDHLLEVYIAAATRHFEWRTGRTVYETEWEVALDCFPCELVIQLPRGFPLISITSIKYMDSTGADTTLSPSAYVVDIYRNRLAPAYGANWPSFTPHPLSAVRIRYKAGKATASPPAYAEAGMRHCILEIVGALYENREWVVPSDRSSVAAFAENPVTKALLSQFKVNYAF